MRDRSRSDALYWQKRKLNADAQFLKTNEWREIRSRLLAVHRHCEDCRLAGVTVKATQVDHIRIPNGDVRLQRDLGNMRALCSSHHAQKTRHDQRADGSARIVGYSATTGHPIFAPAKP
jgi:hypothetical protein